MLLIYLFQCIVSVAFILILLWELENCCIPIIKFTNVNTLMLRFYEILMIYVHYINTNESMFSYHLICNYWVTKVMFFNIPDSFILVIPCVTYILFMHFAQIILYWPLIIMVTSFHIVLFTDSHNLSQTQICLFYSVVAFLSNERFLV